MRKTLSYRHQHHHYHHTLENIVYTYFVVFWVQLGGSCPFEALDVSPQTIFYSNPIKMGTRSVIEHATKHRTNKYDEKRHTYNRSQCSVRVLETAGYLVFLYGRFDVFDQPNDGVILFVGVRQSRLELPVSIDQPLDFLYSVYDEHVHQVFACSVQPVVERLIPLNIIQLNVQTIIYIYIYIIFNVQLKKKLVLFGCTHSCSLGEFQM